MGGLSCPMTRRQPGVVETGMFNGVSDPPDAE